MWKKVFVDFQQWEKKWFNTTHQEGGEAGKKDSFIPCSTFAKEVETGSIKVDCANH